MVLSGILDIFNILNFLKLNFTSTSSIFLLIFSLCFCSSFQRSKKTTKKGILLMGIPYLTRHLLPFSESTTLTREGSSCSRLEWDPYASSYIQSIVIDGPSLVYHVYFRLLSWTTQNVDIFDAQPTCHEVSVGVMMYLLQLTNIGVKM